MSLDSEIVKSLVELSERNNPIVSVVCTVAEAVNMTDLTVRCTPIDGTADIVGVRLMSTPENGFLILPKVNSTVIVTFIDKSNAYISMFSTMDSMQLNGDTYDGLVKVADLVTKLNNLENKVNDLITAMNTHVHTGVTTGVGSSAVGTVPIVGTLTPTVQANIENTTVKHGNGT